MKQFRKELNGGEISSAGPFPAGGSSGGGSINIFYRNLIEKGSYNVNGGDKAFGGVQGGKKIIYSGAGGSGTATYTQIN